MNFQLLFRAFSLCAVVCLSSLAVVEVTPIAPTNRALAKRLYQRLTGTPLLNADPRLAQLEALISQGRLKDAAAICTDDPGFFRVTLKRWAMPMSNRQRSHYVGLNDFSALVIGVARDNIDARQLLAGNFLYKVGDALDPKAFDAAERERRDLKTFLNRSSPQWENMPESAGLLTTASWGGAHYDGGTNRRPVLFALQEFLCTPVEGWREAGLSDHYVRRDVDRSPSGNPGNYQALCRNCHATLDAMSGAFARIDFQAGSVNHSGFSRVAEKMNQNATVYPEGNAVVDDSWETSGTPHQRQRFGWRGKLNGIGIREFGLLLANSERFKTCFAERAFKEICRREPTAREKDTELQGVAARFETDGYKLRSLFEDVAVLPGCLGRGSEAGVGASVARFQEVLEFLASTTGVNPQNEEIAGYYSSALFRLPRYGTPDEVNSNAALAVTGLSGLFCKHFIQAESVAAEASRRAHRGITISDEPLPSGQADTAIQRYTELFWQRPPTPEETGILRQTFDGMSSMRGRDALLVLCTAAASSLDALIR